MTILAIGILLVIAIAIIGLRNSASGPVRDLMQFADTLVWLRFIGALLGIGLVFLFSFMHKMDKQT